MCEQVAGHVFYELCIDVPVTDGDAAPISLLLSHHTSDTLHVGTAGTCGPAANQSQEQQNTACVCIFVCVCENKWHAFKYQKVQRTPLYCPCCHDIYNLRDYSQNKDLVKNREQVDKHQSGFSRPTPISCFL